MHPQQTETLLVLLVVVVVVVVLLPVLQRALLLHPYVLIHTWIVMVMHHQSPVLSKWYRWTKTVQ